MSITHPSLVSSSVFSPLITHSQEKVSLNLDEYRKKNLTHVPCHVASREIQMVTCLTTGQLIALVNLRL